MCGEAGTRRCCAAPAIVGPKLRLLRYQELMNRRACLERRERWFWVPGLVFVLEAVGFGGRGASRRTDGLMRRITELESYDRYQTTEFTGCGGRLSQKGLPAASCVLPLRARFPVFGL